MPALNWFGRRWLLGSDDLTVPSAITAVFHLCWTALLIKTAVSVEVDARCNTPVSTRYELFVFSLLGVFALSFTLEALIAFESTKGSIFETRKRRRVPQLLYVGFLCTLTELGLNVYGTTLYYGDVPVCFQEDGFPWMPKYTILALIWSTWAIIIFLLIILMISYNLFPDYRNPVSWERRCKCCAACCCIYCCVRRDDIPEDEHGNKTPLVVKLGRLFAQMFGHMDMTPTDLTVGFFLAVAAQRYERRKLAMRLYAQGVDGTQAGAELPQDTTLGMGSLPTGSPTCDTETSGASVSSLLQHSQSSLSRPLSAVFNTASRHIPSFLAIDVQLGQILTSAYSHTPKLVTPVTLPNFSEDTFRGVGDFKLVGPQSLKEASYYAKYALAAYGYLLYLISDAPHRRCCGLCFGRNCAMCLGAVGSQVRRELALKERLRDLKLRNQFDKEAIYQVSQFAPADLVFVRYEDEIKGCLVYFIGLDHEMQHVIISIRGSLSLDNVLTDLLFDPASLDDWVRGPEPGLCANGLDAMAAPPLQLAGRDTTYAAHSGILDSARALVADIQSTGHLAALIGHGAPYQQWGVVVTGHSLGAGAATFVAMYLRHFYKRVKCWAYSPPGGLFSPNTAEETRSWCTAVVCGKEWIPRLSVGTLDRLRDNIVLAAARCKVPKVLYVLRSILGKRWTEAELLYPVEGLSGEVLEALAAYQESVRRRDTNEPRVALAATFQPPAKIIFLRPVSRPSDTQAGRRRYEPVWLSPNDLMEEGILLSKRMMADHMPQYLYSTLRKLHEAQLSSVSTAAISNNSAGWSVPLRLQLPEFFHKLVPLP